MKNTFEMSCLVMQTACYLVGFRLDAGRKRPIWVGGVSR